MSPEELHEEILSDTAYHFFENSSKRNKELSLDQDAYKGTYQKCLRNSVGKILYININMWNFKDSFYRGAFYRGVRNPESLSGLSFEVDCQLTSEMGTFNVSLFSIENKSLKEIEKWFLKLWQENHCFYYETQE